MPLPQLIAALFLLSPLCSAHSSGGFSPAEVDHHDHEEQHPPSCGHHHHHHHHGDDHVEIRRPKLPEELAEEEDLELYGFDQHHHHHDHDDSPDLEFSAVGLWVRAMGCSLLVSMASLICLAILPLIFVKGKPSKMVVDSLALFGAGAMLGDAFLHQLPHAFGGEHSHSHEHHHISHTGDHHEHGHSHSHSLQDLSVGLSILSGILLFLLVEKVVRYVEEHPGNKLLNLGHGHHHHKTNQKLKVDEDSCDSSISENHNEKQLDGKSDSIPSGEKHTEHEALLHKRNNSTSTNTDDREDTDVDDDSLAKKPTSTEVAPSRPTSNLVFGYLNLISDGVHNFTDGMALGSAFLLYGSVGGWSRTLFLLAHEIPQEVGDFGILVRSGFTVFKALAFNFLSALVALAGTALALVLGKQPGQSSLIEGFTAGGFIYIAVAGVLPEMNNEKTTVGRTVIQVISLTLGMVVALGISLVE